MNIVVTPSFFHKTIKIPTSKSYANRLLILSALYPEDFILHDVNLCEDVAYLVSALKKIGIEIEKKQDQLIVKGIFPECEENNLQTMTLELGDGGTTVRFILPLLCLGKRLYRLKLGEQIKKRPLDSLIQTLKNLGASLSWEDDFLCVQGPIQNLPKSIIADTTETSQFASSLALAFSRFSAQVQMPSESSAYSYFALTLDVIEKVKRGQRDFNLPADFSSLAYPLALAAVKGEVCISNCFEKDFYQADSILLDVFTRMNVPFSWTEKGLLCHQALELKSFEQDCQNCQDLVPVLAYLASFAQGVTLLRGLKNLRHKEIDRIKGITSILDLFSVPWRFDEQSFSLYITGGKSCAPFVQWNSLPDHRMIMMIYLFMRSLNGGEILEAQYVAKSFPTFFEVMNP